MNFKGVREFCMKASLLSMLFMLLMFSGYGQTKSKLHKEKDSKQYLSSHPVWIQCIDSQHALLRYAQYAFDAYWQGKERPLNEEGEDGGKEGFEGEGRENIQYSIEYKRFRDWEAKVKNMIGEDGRVLTVEKQIEIWEQVQREKEEQSK